VSEQFLNGIHHNISYTVPYYYASLVINLPCFIVTFASLSTIRPAACKLKDKKRSSAVAEQPHDALIVWKYS